MAETVKGFNDYTGEEARKRAEIKKILIQEFEKYGFEPAESPVVEYEEFVQGDNAQDDAVSDIFKLEDRGKRKLALRYEFTFQLKRLARNKKLPYKRYQIGSVFRDEPVGGNRYRQFTQADADIIGSSIRDEAEVLALANNILSTLGIKAEININNRKLINEILDELDLDNDKKEQVIREIDKLDKLDEKEIVKNLKELMKNPDKLLDILKKPENWFKKYESYEEIEELTKYCKLYGIKINFKPSLARGLAYYVGSVFEINVEDTKDSICGGGTYLINNIQSTGWSFGLNRLSKLIKIPIIDKTILIISLDKDKKAIKLAEKLRGEGISCRIGFGKLTKNLEIANSLG